MGTVANLVVRVSANVSDFEKGIGSLQGQWKRVGTKLESIGGDLTAALTVPLAGAAIATTKFSVDFEAAMVKIETTASESASNIGVLREDILALAPTVGIGPKALADGLLVIESTGFRGAQAMEILTLAAQQSAIGLGDTKDIARALTSVLTAYGTENLSAAQAADILFKTIDIGAADADTLAGEFGRVVGVAAQLGVSFVEVGAFIGTYTRLGLTAAEATTALSGVLRNILKPSEQARGALASIGLTAADVRQQVAQQGLGGALIDLLDKLNGNTDAIGALFGNVRALAGVMGTAGVQAQIYTANIQAIGDAAGITQERFKIWEGTTAATWAKFVAGVQVTAIALGDRLAPTFSKVLNAAMPLLDTVARLAEWFGQLPAPVQTVSLALLGIVAAVGPITYGFGAILKAGSALLGLLNLSGVTAVFAGIADAVALVVSGFTGAVGGVAGFAGALEAIVVVAGGPVTLAIAGIVTAIAAVVTATGSWGTVWQVLKDIIASVADIIIIVAKAIASLAGLIGSTLIDALKSSSQWFGSWIPNFVKETLGWFVDKLQLLRRELDYFAGRNQGPPAPGKQIGDIVLPAQAPATPGALTGGGGGDESALQKAIKGLHEQMASSVVQAQAWAAQINALGGLANTTAKQHDELHTALQHVIDQYGSLDKAGLGALQDLYDATKPLLQVTKDFRDLNGGFGVLPAGGSGVLDPSLLTLISHGGEIKDTAAQIEALQRQGLFASASLGQMGLTIGELPNVVPQATDALKAVHDEINKTATAGARLSDAFQGAFGNIGTTISDFLQQAFTGGGGITGAFKALATKIGGAFGGAIGGAFGPIGAQIGQTIGSLIGPLVSKLKDLFTGGPEWKKFQNDVGRDWGVHISDALAQSLEQESKTLGRQATSVLHLDELIQAAGGLEKFGFDKAVKGVHDLFALLGQGKLTLDQVSGEFDKVFGELAPKAIEKTTGLVSKAFLELQGLALQNHVQSPQLDQFRSQQIGGVTGGLSAFFDSKAIVQTQDAATALAATIVAAFGELQRQGQSLPAIFQTITPLIDALSLQLQTTGFTGGEAFTQIKALSDLASNAIAGPAFTAVSGLRDVMTGLANTGLLTQPIFSGLATQITDTFNGLIAQGFDSNQVLQLMQPTLQTLWALQNQFGFAIDSSTQAMLNQAATQGLVGEQMKPVNEQMLDVLKAIATVLGADIPNAMANLPGAAASAVGGVAASFLTLPGAAAAAAGGIRNALGSLDLHVQVQPEYRQGPDVAMLATGGIVTRPTLAMVGEAGPEAVVPLDELRRGGTGGVGHITVNVNAPYPSEGSWIRSSVTKGVIDAIRQNKHGAFTDFEQLVNETA